MRVMASIVIALLLLGAATRSIWPVLGAGALLIGLLADNRGRWGA